MIYIIHLSLGLIVAKKNSTQLRGGVKNKVVLLGGAHHKVASPVVVKVPLFCGKITSARGGAHKLISFNVF